MPTSRSSNILPRALDVEVPDGWELRESLTSYPRRDRYAANVIVSSEPVDSAVTTEYYAGVLGQMLERDAEISGYRQHEQGETRFLGHEPALFRDFTQAPSDGEPVRQIQFYLVRGGQGYTATASVPTTFADDWRETLRDRVAAFFLLESSELKTGAALGARLVVPPDPDWMLKRELKLGDHEGSASLILAAVPADERLDAERFAEHQRADADELPGFEELDYGEAPVFGGRPGIRRICSWGAPGELPVTQVQHYYCFGGIGYLSTVTTHAAEWDARHAELTALMDSLDLGEVEGAPDD